MLEERNCNLITKFRFSLFALIVYKPGSFPVYKPGSFPCFNIISIIKRNILHVCLCVFVCVTAETQIVSPANLRNYESNRKTSVMYMSG